MEIDAEKQPAAFASRSLDHVVERIACLDVESLRRQYDASSAAVPKVQYAARICLMMPHRSA